MKVLFVAGFGPVLRDPVAGPALYVDALGLPLGRDDDGYWHTERLPGVKSFALWPLSQVAQSCFGTETWPEDCVGAGMAKATLGWCGRKRTGSDHRTTATRPRSEPRRKSG